MTRTPQNFIANSNTPPGPRSILHSPSSIRSAFSLTEIMIVIVIIVLVLGMAMPVFKYMNGSRSQAGASNQIAAFLGRARNDAIGLQIPTGVAFFTDTTGRTLMAEVQRVRDVGFPLWNSTAVYSRGMYVTFGFNPARYFVYSNTLATAGNSTSDTVHWTECDQYATDQILGTDADTLPAGVGVQLVNNPVFLGTPPLRKSDGYVSTGAIMFDANGRLVSLPVSFAQGGAIGLAQRLATNFPRWQSTTPGTPPVYVNNITPIDALYSQFGLVLYDRDALTSMRGSKSTIDPTYTSNTTYSSAYGTIGSNPPSEADEEFWLDKNASPLLINRYNGTLLRSD